MTLEHLGLNSTQSVASSHSSVIAKVAGQAYAFGCRSFFPFLRQSGPLPGVSGTLGLHGFSMHLLRVLNWIFIHLIPATVFAGHQMLAGPLAVAVDTHDAFLHGLRARGYYDTALDYLDAVEHDDRVSDEVRATLDFERAAIWKAQGKAARRTDLKTEAFTRAESTFRTFAELHPDHERAAWANSEAGQLLFDRARRILWERPADATPEQIEALAEQARQLIAEARDTPEASSFVLTVLAGGGMVAAAAGARMGPFGRKEEEPTAKTEEHTFG